MKIVTGYTGGKHVTPIDDASFNRGTIGTGDYVLSSDSTLITASIVTNNSVKVTKGSVVSKGRHAIILSDETVAIENGTAGQNRVDSIVARFTTDGTTGYNSCTLTVLKGTAGSTTPATLTQTDTTYDMLLFYVNLNGLNISSITTKYTAVKTMLTQQNLISTNTTNITNLQSAMSNVQSSLTTTNANVTNVTSVATDAKSLIDTLLADIDYTRNNTDYKIRIGDLLVMVDQVTINPTSNGVITTNVLFHSGFKYVASVLTSIHSSRPDLCSTSVGNITTTGFTLYSCKTSGNTEYYVRYVAIGIAN